MLPVFLHMQIVQAFVCQLSSLYRIAPSSSPQLSSFMSLFNGSRLLVNWPSVFKPTVRTVVQNANSPDLAGKLGSMVDGISLRIHFSDYQGQYTRTGHNMNQAGHRRIPLFEIDHIHKFVVYKASIHKYSQRDNIHHQSIVPLKVCFKFQIM